MNRFEIVEATIDDNESLCRLMAVPMKGKIHLSKNRMPDYFKGAKIQNTNTTTFVCKDKFNDKLCAVLSIGKRLIYLNGKLKSIQYASDLRIDKDYQSTEVLLILLNKFIDPNHLYLAQGVVISDNKRMLRLIEKVNQKKNSTYFHFLGLYNSYIQPVNRRINAIKQSSLNINKASSKDIPALQNYFNKQAPLHQFYPHYEFKNLSDDYYCDLNVDNFIIAKEQNTIVGIIGIWDLNKISKNIVVGYDFPYNILRPTINVINHKLLGGIKLPKTGARLRTLYLHTILIKKNNIEVFKKLLHHVNKIAYNRKFDNLAIGLSEFSPFDKVLKSFKNNYQIPANYYLINTEPNTKCGYEGKEFYLELARL